MPILWQYYGNYHGKFKSFQILCKKSKLLCYNYSIERSRFGIVKIKRAYALATISWCLANRIPGILPCSVSILYTYSPRLEKSF